MIGAFLLIEALGLCNTFGVVGFCLIHPTAGGAVDRRSVARRLLAQELGGPGLKAGEVARLGGDEGLVNHPGEALGRPLGPGGEDVFHQLADRDGLDGGAATGSLSGS